MMLRDLLVIHGIIPNQDLTNLTLDMIKEINDIYVKKFRNSKSIAKTINQNKLKTTMNISLYDQLHW
jgi:hypothetical protein